MLKPAPLEYVVLFPLLVVVAGIGVGEGVVLVAQPAVSAALLKAPQPLARQLARDYSLYQLSPYKEIFCKIKVCILACS
jgi:hypothetical protein